MPSSTFIPLSLLFRNQKKTSVKVKMVAIRTIKILLKDKERNAGLEVQTKTSFKLK